MRTFTYPSQLTDGNLALALATALTPEGIDPSPNFFSGFAVYPQALARGLLTLADVTSTRYFHYTPVSQRDPVLSAQGNRLRAECFSACNGVHARLDLLESGFDGRIALGTTNVDIGMELRTALTRIRQEDRLRVDIGSGGLTVLPVGKPAGNLIQMGKSVQERPVQMPDRWIRALGNAAAIHRRMTPVFTVNGSQAQVFVASLPAATGKNLSGWLTCTPAGVKLTPRRSPSAVFVSGLHRLSALKRLMTHISGMTFYAPSEGEPGAFMAEALLPGARLTLSLTAEAWQGYSGEGSLLESLAKPDVLEDAESIRSGLAFDALIDENLFGRQWAMNPDRVQTALGLLAVSGKLGYDAHDQAYFHRELPDDPDRVLKDNPRLAAARKLVDTVRHLGNHKYVVRSGDADYPVTYDPAQGTGSATCACTWYLNHQNSRGPCKHILAVQLREEEPS
ncbi:MAG: hypothetical protein LBC55_09670 [Desulfovibrio sp.]|nr:hypothetical protein [Desulfovibrio sp.]